MEWLKLHIASHRQLTEEGATSWMERQDRIRSRIIFVWWVAVKEAQEELLDRGRRDNA